MASKDWSLFLEENETEASFLDGIPDCRWWGDVSKSWQQQVVTERPEQHTLTPDGQLFS